MAKTIRINKTTLKAINPVKGKQVIYRDRDLPGFRLVVGRRISYQVYRKVNGTPCKFVFGTYPDLPPDRARIQAEALLAEMHAGVNPALRQREHRLQAQKKAQSQLSLAEAFDKWKAMTSARWKPRTLTEYEHFMTHHFADWQAKPVAAITEDHVMEKFRVLTQRHGSAQANLALRILRALFNAVADGDQKNPVNILTRKKLWNKISPRQRFLKADQIGPFYQAVMNQGLPKHNPSGQGTGEVVRDYLLFILFTCVRESEAASLKWENVNFQEATMLLEDTKNRTDFLIPMTDAVRDVLKRRLADREQLAQTPLTSHVGTGTSSNPHVFRDRHNRGHLVSPQKRLKRITDECGFKVSEHDLRRSLATHSGAAGIPYALVSKMLNHSTTGLGSPTTDLYCQTDLEQLRQGFSRWEAFVLKQVRGETAASPPPNS